MNNGMNFKICFSVLLGILVGYLFHESCSKVNNQRIRL